MSQELLRELYSTSAIQVIDGECLNHSVSCFAVKITFRLRDCEIDVVDGSNRERGEHYHLCSLNIHTDETFAEFDITFYAT
jgi:hypothetical protein